MSAGLLIDDDGECVPEGHPKLSKRLKTNRAGTELATFVVRNLGFIRLVPRDTTVVIQFNPGLVAVGAIAGAYHWLCGSQTDRAIVEPIATTEPAHILGSRRDIIAYLGALLDARTQRPDFMATRLDLANSQLGKRLRVAMDVMQANLTIDFKSELLARMFDGGITFSQFDPAAATIRVSAVGDGISRLMPDAPQRFIGNSYADALGGPYGTWVMEVVTTAALSGQPINESVEAVLKIGQQRPRRIFYERLIVPHRDAKTGLSQILTVTTAA